MSLSTKNGVKKLNTFSLYYGKVSQLFSIEESIKRIKKFYGISNKR